MQANRLGSLTGRVLLSVIFILSGLGKIPHFNAIAAGLHQTGWPAATLLIALSIAIEVGCGLLLLTGFKARYAALVLAAWLVPVTLTFHGFWHYAGAQQQEQMINFLKNLAIIGGLLVFSTSSAVTGRRRAGSMSAAK
jgi:putative oxidoreductase